MTSFNAAFARATLSFVTLIGIGSLEGGATCAAEYFAIRVVDEATDRGVPLVELTTVNDVRFYTDSHGLVAVHEPELMDREVYFHVRSHGYEFPADGFGYRGQRLRVVAGQEAVLRLKRQNIAERLYRVTGAGIYRDSVLTGQATPPIQQPLMNGGVLGSDSVVNAVFRGKIHWFWGDTNRLTYPLGNFHVPGATSLLPSAGGLDPEQGVDLAYFLDTQGFAKPTCQMPGKGPTWIDALTVMRDEDGQERLFAKYVKVEGLLDVYERGLVEFNPATNAFEKRRTFPEQAPVYPGGHPVEHQVDDVRYIYFTEPFPWVRVRAIPEAFLDLAQYEAFTCVREGSPWDEPELERDEDGRLMFRWRHQARAWTPTLENQLLKKGRIAASDARFKLQDITSDKLVSVHSGSVYWNAYRDRWVMIVLERFGTSALGEIWFTDAPELEGPWQLARKLVMHDRYSFYNPKQHPMLAKDGGRIIFFEGTYTHTFSGNTDKTPRYDYNQIMYKLDLSDARLARELFESNSTTSSSR